MKQIGCCHFEYVSVGRSKLATPLRASCFYLFLLLFNLFLCVFLIDWSVWRCSRLCLVSVSWGAPDDRLPCSRYRFEYPPGKLLWAALPRLRNLHSRWWCRNRICKPNIAEAVDHKVVWGIEWWCNCRPELRLCLRVQTSKDLVCWQNQATVSLD